MRAYKSLMIWFIGAQLHVTKHENGQFRKALLPKKEEQKASTTEVLKFLRKLEYKPPFKRPSKRTVYRWLEELERAEHIRIANQIQRKKGRPEDVFELTEKGQEYWKLIDKQFEAHAKLKGPSGILFSLDPNNQWMTAHVMIRDPEIIRVIKRELARLNKERGRPRDDLFFRGHPAFENIGAMVFILIMGFLRLPGQKVSPEARASMLQILNSLPAVFNYNRQDLDNNTQP